MYKVFINEKKLTINNNILSIDKNLTYEGISTIEMAIDLLENTPAQEVNIFAEDTESVWEDFTNHFKSIEAAGGVVFNSDKDVLFIYRLSRWDLPKGKIEKNETIEKAALREVKEECGIDDLIIEEFITSTFHIYIDRNGKKILKTTYWYRMNYYGNQVLVPQQEEGISKVEWKNEQQIATEVFPNTFQNIKIVLEEVKKQIK